MNESEYRRAERHLWQQVGLDTPDEKYVTMPSSGARVRVQIIGNGPPVLFLHGSPNAGSTFAPIVPSFDGHRCLLVDRPGCGLSEPHVEEDVGRLLRVLDTFIPEVLDGLDVDRAHVVASSFGGFITIRSASRHPDRVRRIVQLGCPAMVPGMRIPTFMRMLSLRAFRWLMTTLPPNERAGDAMLRQIGHGASLDAGRIPQSFKDWYLAMQRYTDTMRNETATIGRALSFRGGFDPALTLTEDVVAGVTAPTLFLWGADDAFGDEQVARRVVDMHPEATLEMIPDAGHLPWLDFPDEVGARAKTFLDAG